MSIHSLLRDQTAADHDAVDAAFTRFTLADPISYGDFLTAHARAVPAVEAALAAGPTLPPWRPRSGLLRADLAALGRALPDPFPVAVPPTPADAFGMLYVIEGSRLGGGWLSKRVPPNLPHAYLAATHLSGEWRTFLAAMTATADAAGPDWTEAAIAAAKRTFALFGDAAAA